MTIFYAEMKETIVTLYSEEDTLSFVIRDTSDDNTLFDLLIENIKQALCGKVVNDGVVNFQTTQQCHIDNIERLKEHIAKELPKLKLPKLNAIAPWLKKVGEGKFFAICFNREPSLEEVMAIHAYIKELNGGEKMETNLSNILDTAGDVLANYEIKASDPDKRVRYGNEPSGKKVCRYCHRAEPDVTFHKVAHTFSEGLGNKFTITCNECDDCNAYFGNTCEPDFIAYLDVMRPLFHVKGKDGEIKKIEGKNFTVMSDAIDNKLLKIEIKQTSDNLNPIKETEGVISFDLNHTKNIVPQNIYRTLVKFAYGIIPNECLDKFTFTADWLLGNKVIDQLPLVMISRGNTFVKHPRVVAYIRKNERVDLPFAIGEFWVMDSIFVYVIPTDENSSFREKQEWEALKQIFRCYEAINWIYKDFSSTTSQQMKFHFNFKKRNQ